MITVNDKLHLFTKRIIERRQEAYDKKVYELENKMVEELHNRKILLENDRIKYETTLLKGIKSERKQRLSNARSEYKRRLLLKRKNMIDVLLEGVKTYTEDFVETEAYWQYLEKLFVDNQSSILELGAFSFYINQSDFDSKLTLFKELFDRLNFICNEIEIYDQIIIGGGVLVKEDGSTRIDLSLDSVIEDNKTYMGQLIYSILEDAGEIDGEQS